MGNSLESGRALKGTCPIELLRQSPRGVIGVVTEKNHPGQSLLLRLPLPSPPGHLQHLPAPEHMVLLCPSKRKQARPSPSSPLPIAGFPPWDPHAPPMPHQVPLLTGGRGLLMPSPKLKLLLGLSALPSAQPQWSPPPWVPPRLSALSPGPNPPVFLKTPQWLPPCLLLCSWSLQSGPLLLPCMPGASFG